MAAIAGSGCSEYMDEFRDAASPSLRTGVDALLDGFVEGVFAVVEPDEGTQEGADTTGEAP